MQNNILTRMGDGERVSMPADEIKEELVLGTQDAAQKGGIPELTQEDLDQMFEILAESGRIVSVPPGDEVVVTDDGCAKVFCSSSADFDPTRARTDPEQPMKHPSPIVLTIDAVLRPLGVLIYLAIAAVSYPIVSFFWPRHRTRQILKTDVSRPSAKLGEVVPPAEHPPAEHLPADAWPSVTVVVPAYNSQETIAGCIESLVNLHYPREKLEIIVADNGSRDSTVAIASRYPVRVLREEQRGAAAARNCGIREARGEYIAFTDSDCQVAPDWLHELVRAAIENKSDGGSNERANTSQQQASQCEE